MKFLGKKSRIFILILVALLLIGVWFRWTVSVQEPTVSNEETYQNLNRTKWNNGWRCGNNRISKNDHGIYELYVEGNAYERGYVNGLLAKELIEKQEVFFVGQLEKHIPSSFNQYMIRLVVGWLNKDLDDYVPTEYKEEIYGVSQFASQDYNYIAPRFQRILNYHGAHDIGHAMQNMNLVACTSFGLWGDKTVDGKLWLGRNFDFYVGDGFAEDKIIMFIKPDKGYRMMLVTWGGMIGVVSGMNEHGLTLTLNAAPSDMPSGTATPVSIIAREVLQYAKTIDEAYAIVKGRKAFVSETFMIGSANDSIAAIIEKTPDTTLLFRSSAADRILCTNHFQHSGLSNSEKNKAQMLDNPTMYRYQRLQELLKEGKFDQNSIASVLRNQKGLKGEAIGAGNEGAINQLIAHHSVIFCPEERIVWVSSNPYQLGEYLAYDLDEVFKTDPLSAPAQLYNSALTIAADSFLYSTAYANFKTYHVLSQQIREADEEWLLSAEQEQAFINSNSDYYNTYLIMARYYGDRKNYKQGIFYLNKASEKVIPGETDKKLIAELKKEYSEAL